MDKISKSKFLPVGDKKERLTRVKWYMNPWLMCGDGEDELINFWVFIQAVKRI